MPHISRVAVSMSLLILAVCGKAWAQAPELPDEVPESDEAPESQKVSPMPEAPRGPDHFALEVSPFTIAAFFRLGGTLEWLPVPHHAFFVYFARVQIPSAEQERGFVAAQGYRIYSKSGGPHGVFGTLLVEEGDIAFTENPKTPNARPGHARSIGVAIEGGYKWSLDGWLLGIGAGLTVQHSTWSKGGFEHPTDPTLYGSRVLPRVVFDIGRAF
jgi:hypothetical protein